MDGLNSIKFELLSTSKEQLYTNYTVLLDYGDAERFAMGDESFATLDKSEMDRRRKRGRELRKMIRKRRTRKRHH